MVKKATIVEINGRQYDAITGKLLSGSPVSATTAASKPRAIDGFSSHITGTHPSRPQPKNANSVHKVTRKTQKLHPAAVKKSTPQKAIHSVASSQAAQKTSTVPSSVSQRMLRAQAQQKSTQITRFGKQEPVLTTPVRQALLPEEKIAAYQPPALKAVTASTQTPAREVISKIEPSSAKSAKKSAKNKKLKLVPTVAVVAIVILAAGYLTYINLPNFALKVAASRAGFDATLPGYNPSGFEFDGPIAYSPGHLTLKFANSDNAEYKISQRESSWDSQSLLDNFVERENKNYLTFQERGLTVYIYDDNQASWVDGGVWYTIEGNSSLTSEQILKIASSL